MSRRQSDPTGNPGRKKGPSYFTFSPGDQAVGHSGFDKLLRWAEIDFPANPVYAEPQHLPQLRLPDTIMEEKLVEHMARSRISSSGHSTTDMVMDIEPMTAPVRNNKVHRQQAQAQHMHVSFDPAALPPLGPSTTAAASMSPTSSTSRSRNIRPARKSLERQWIALAQQHIRTSGAPTASSSSTAVLKP